MNQNRIKSVVATLPGVWQHDPKRLRFRGQIRRRTLASSDVADHDPAVIEEAQQLIARDHPALIIKTCPPTVTSRLIESGYMRKAFPNSPNTMFFRT